MTTGQVRGPAIHVRALQKSYGELHVLRGVDFDVARGSIFALLGSNGASKTTVVGILSTLLKADEGTVTVAGFELPRKRRTCESPSVSPGSSGPWTRSSPEARTSS
jgi:ABC-2 type transport system ATP-binding protein